MERKDLVRQETRCTGPSVSVKLEFAWTILHGAGPHTKEVNNGSRLRKNECMQKVVLFKKSELRSTKTAR